MTDTTPPPTEQEHARRVQGIFERITGVYDLLNRVLSLGLDRLWRKKLVASVQPFPSGGTARILDLAAGTMDVTVGLAKKYPHRSLFAVDFCRPMLAQGMPKLRKFSGQHILPLVADGRRLPLPDASVDAITIAFGLRNIRPREEAYAEALRVLVPGGKFCILEFGSAHDRILFGLYNFYLTKVLPQIGRLVSKDKAAYQYLADTIVAFPAAKVLAKEMETAGFAKVTYSTQTGGIVCLHIAQKGM